MMSLIFERRQCGSLKNTSVLVIFPHWGTAYWPYEFFARLFSKEFRVLVYYYSDDLLTADIEATLRNMLSLEEFVFDDLANISKLSSLSIFGVSLGSTIATRLANRIASPNGGHIKETPLHLVLCMSGASFPWAVWYGESTQHIRRELEAQNMTIHDLTGAWSQFSPIQNLSFLKTKNVPILFFGSRRDKTLDTTNVRVMERRLQTEHPRARIFLSRFLGHRACGIKSMLRVPLIKKFLLNGCKRDFSRGFSRGSTS